MLKVKYPNSENFCNPVNSVNRFCNFLTRSLQRGCLATGEKISELQFGDRSYKFYMSNQRTRSKHSGFAKFFNKRASGKID